MVVIGENGRPLMLFYLRINNWTAGSVYKYHSLLLSRFGGLAIERAIKGDVVSLIDRHKPDLFFCHGDWLLDYQIPFNRNIPYILIEHDIHSLRTQLNKKQLRNEKEMLENAKGIVFTSEDHKTYCNKHFKITTNQVIVHLRPLRRDLAWQPLDKKPGKHLVYAGGLAANTGSNYGYRSYHSIFKAFIDVGWTVHIYPASVYMESTAKSYKRLGCHLHKNLSYNSLLQQMSQYTAGLQAYAKEGVRDRTFNYTQTCRPNKVWDYLAAGIPTIGLYHGNCAKIYLDGGWGITVTDTKQSTLENIELPSFPDSLRFEQVMENDTLMFEKVIDKALSKKKKAPKETKPKGEEDNMANADHLWHRVTKPVVEKGRLLHGRGKRIPIKEAIRLGLVKKEVIVKDKIKKRVEKKAAKIETKPLVDEKESGSFKNAFEKKGKRTKKDELKALTATVKVIEKLKVEED